MLAGVHVDADPGELVQEPAQHLLAVRGVQHLGVILHAGQPARAVLERRHRRAGADWPPLEPVGRLGDRVAVAHPHRLGRGQIRMQLSPSDIQFGAAVLAGPGVGHGAAERLRHRLEAVADAEHRHAEVEQRGVELRGASAYTLAGPPDSTMACGSLALISSTVAVCGMTSEYTLASRTRRAISWAYCAPKSTTNTGRGDAGTTRSV